eukprot:Skav228495  [mRNA]  locus=scaffold1092:303780:306793:- [translate_table: standard]
MKLLVEFCERPSCYAALHSSDTSELFKSGTSRHFCRPLRVQRGLSQDPVFVGWIGDQCLTPGRMQLSKPFAECLGLEEGQQVEVFAHSAPVHGQFVAKLRVDPADANKSSSRLNPGGDPKEQAPQNASQISQCRNDWWSMVYGVNACHARWASRRQHEWTVFLCTQVSISSSGGESCFHLRVFALLEDCDQVIHAGQSLTSVGQIVASKPQSASKQLSDPE